MFAEDTPHARLFVFQIDQIDIAAEELKAREQTEKTEEGTWQRKGGEPRWTETHNHHNLGGSHRTGQGFQCHHSGLRGGQVR